MINHFCLFFLATVMSFVFIKVLYTVRATFLLILKLETWDPINTGKKLNRI